MTMGDRIKTRQQLLDEQQKADAALARATPDNDRHLESARLHQAPGSTGSGGDVGEESGLRAQLH